MYYGYYCKFVSLDLAHKLHQEYIHKVSPYLEFVKTHREQFSSKTQECLLSFVGEPADNLRILFYIITFNEVFTLLQQGYADVALSKARRMVIFDYIYWGYHELDLISMGHLLK